MAALLLAWAALAQTPYPPLSTEVSAEHPLFVFRVAPVAGQAGPAYGQAVTEAWQQLPDAFKPYSALDINVPKAEEMVDFLQGLQTAAIPVVVRVAAGGRGGRQDLAQLEGVLSAYTTIRGIAPRGMRLDVYDGPEDSGDIARGNAAWIAGAVELAAKYGRFVSWPVTGLDAARFMAHPAYAPARAKMTELAAYVFPLSVQRGEHVTQGNAACMGLWLSGGCGAWGVAADTAWYGDARLVSPGTMGKGGEAKAPPALYRSMLLAGSMAGAWVYSFESPEDLWIGKGTAWNDVIAPVLGQLIDLGLPPRKEFVSKAVPVAYQLVEAGDPAAFHKNLHDLSPVLDAGVMWRAAFGGATGPLPARGGLPAIPVLPAGPPAGAPFTTVIQADDTARLEQRKAVVDAAHAPLADGEAFIAQVGRGIYVFNTDIAKQTPQAYAILEAPAAVRGLTAQREGANVALAWPFREGDVSYNVYKRTSPQLRFTQIARGTEERKFTDVNVPPGDTVAYAVTALTNDKEPLKGTVNFSESLVFSVVESRIAEEALLTPELTSAAAHVAAGFSAPPLSSPTPQDGLDETQAGIAKGIAERLEAWKKAFEMEDLAATMGIYADEYEDPAGWRLQYVKRAYQWFFERCGVPRFAYQIRRWDFASYATSGQVNAVVYLSLRANTISDASGRQADIDYELPRTATNEVTLSFTGSGGVWRIQRSDPPVPNFDELLAYSAGPFDDAKAAATP